MTVRVLAVADSDAYLKWAVATLGSLELPGGELAERVRTRTVVVRSPVLPTPAQVAAATAGSAGPDPDVMAIWQLRRLLRSEPFDVVLVAATGPVGQVVGRLVHDLPGRRPALVTGLPGLALPATAVGVRRRAWCDAFVVHSRAERDAYRAAFAAQGLEPRIVLGRLPFAAPAVGPGPSGGARATVVFAAQPSVPAERAERVQLLAGLAAAAARGLDVVVKLRATKGERQTHLEPYPYPQLWAEEHERLGHPAGRLRFATGPLRDWLRPGTTLVTVSSTAALESLAAGVPTVLVADLGVRDDLLNPPFASSGLLRPLDELPAAVAAGVGGPDPIWAREHGLHDDASELSAAVGDLAERSRTRRLPRRAVPVGRRSVLRLVVPVRVARALR